MFDDRIAPCPRVPEGPGPHPVFVVKATSIWDGLILCFGFSHRAVDGAAMATLMKAFAEGCRICVNKESPEPSEGVESIALKVMETHDQARKELLDMNRPDTIPSELHFPFILKSGVSSDSSTPESECAMFTISSQGLRELKTARSPPKPHWISTNDAVSALIMSCVARARQARPLGTINAHITINARSKFAPPLPKDYMGNCCAATVATLSANDLLDGTLSGLSACTQAIRKAIISLTSQKVEAIAAFTHAHPAGDIDFEFAYHGDQSKRDYGLNSWADWGLYDADFGFGYPAFVRQCAASWSDSCRILPRRRDGSQEVIIGLEKGDMARFRQDRIWRAFTAEAGQ